eukprot:42507-Pleurochrysis_carterae.AAC.2
MDKFLVKYIPPPNITRPVPTSTAGPCAVSPRSAEPNPGTQVAGAHHQASAPALDRTPCAHAHVRADPHKRARARAVRCSSLLWRRCEQHLRFKSANVTSNHS